jgi:hypothetical protein
MKKQNHRLALKQETLKILTKPALKAAAGGENCTSVTHMVSGCISNLVDPDKA